jgi:hypothetical protein
MQTEYWCENMLESQLDHAEGKISNYSRSCSRVLFENLTLTYVFETITRIVLNTEDHYCVHKKPLFDC